MGLFKTKSDQNIHQKTPDCINHFKIFSGSMPPNPLHDTCTSDMKSIRNGVPQGSILGPLLFLIYINGFPNSSKLVNFLVYADDTTLFFCLEDIKSDNKELVLNNELQRGHSWLKANRLSLNVKKTKYMLFRKQKRTDIRELNLRISNDAIQSVDDFNFLGLYINSKLNWDTHRWSQIKTGHIHFSNC